MQVNPLGTIELCFGVLCLVSSLLFSSSVTLWLSCMMALIKHTRAAKMKEPKVLCQFLRQARADQRRP